MIHPLVLFLFSNLISFIISDVTPLEISQDRPHLIDIFNELSLNIKLCWRRDVSESICHDIPKESKVILSTFNDEIFVFNYDNIEYFLIVYNGKYSYSIKEIIDSTQQFPNKTLLKEIIYIKSPKCIEYLGYDTLAMFSDGIRQEAYDHSYGLCFCSIFNRFSTYNIDDPNPKFPIIYSDNLCDCDNVTHQYNFWLPCEVSSPAPQDLYNYHLNSPLHCNETSQIEEIQQIRIFYLHSTTKIDNLSMKNRIWTQLVQYYGRRFASLIMPESYFLESTHENDMFLGICARLYYEKDLYRRFPHHKFSVERKPSSDYFIMKDVGLHRQRGITIQSFEEILDENYFLDKLWKAESNPIPSSSETTDEDDLHDDAIDPQPYYSFATKFLADPFLINGYKLNIRRYLLVVCEGRRLRAYVHYDGKCIYTPEPYQEPWDQQHASTCQSSFNEVESNDTTQHNSSKRNYNKDRLITTGYVPESHYDDKPITIQELYHLLELKHPKNKKQLRKLINIFESSLYHRLALSIHASENLCEYSPESILTSPLPKCLENSIRFQHFGCDFHIDSHLNGKESRLFECNKGPDMSVHSHRDGSLKRAVATDFMHFIGLKGKFNSTKEHMEQHHVQLIYDSNSFDIDESLKYLHDLDTDYIPIPFTL